MGSRYTDGAGNRLWQDYPDTPVYVAGSGPGSEIMRIDAAQGDSQRIVVRPVNDFATPGASATGQWSLEGTKWEPCPYYDPTLGTFTATGVFALGANKPLIFADIGNYFRIIANTAGGYAVPAQPNLVAGLTGDDGIVFGTAAAGSAGSSAGSPSYVSPAASATGGVTPSANTTVGSSRQLKTGAGSLYGLNVVAGATAGFIMLFDSAAVPADGAVTPLWVLPLAANTGYSGSPSGGDVPIAFANGLVAVFSSTGPFTKTASATAFIGGEVK